MSSTWAALSPRVTSRARSPDRVLATAADFREELVGFAKGALSDVIAQRTREQLDGFLAGPLREELRGLEERLRSNLRAAPQGLAADGGGGGRLGGLRLRGSVDDYGLPSGGVAFGGTKRASVMLAETKGAQPPAPPGANGAGLTNPFGATSWVTKRRISTLVKQTAAAQKRKSSTARQSLYGKTSTMERHADNPSYAGMPLVGDDDGAEEGNSSEWAAAFQSDGFYDPEVEAAERAAAEEEERIAKMSAMRGRMHARMHEGQGNREMVATMMDEAQESSLPPAPPPPKMTWKWVQQEFYPWAFTVVQSSAFEYTSCVAVLINSILLGIETDYLARHIHDQHVPMTYQMADTALCVFFFFELMARVGVHGKSFFCGDSATLNIFDTVLVAFQVIDEIVALVHIHTNSGILIIRNLRIIRFLRILRLTRVLSLIGELRTLLVSIACSMKSLVWVVILLCVLTYSFGIFLTHIVISARLQHAHEGIDGIPWEGEAKLTKWYGSVVTSMLSLFEAVSEGVHWAEAMDPLAEYCSPWLMVAFLGYIVFAIFALLNVVTGLFVEAAIATATEDKKMVLCQQMCQMFVDCDDDNSGTVSWEEWKKHLDNPQMENYLKELDIDKHEAPLLFHLLDGDGSGEIEAEELVGGCLRLHGAAKALELAALIHEFRAFSKQVLVHASRVEEVMNLAPIEQPAAARSVSDLAAGNVPGFGRMTTKKEHDRASTPTGKSSAAPGTASMALGTGSASVAMHSLPSVLEGPEELESPR